MYKIFLEQEIKNHHRRQEHATQQRNSEEPRAGARGSSMEKAFYIRGLTVNGRRWSVNGRRWSANGRRWSAGNPYGYSSPLGRARSGERAPESEAFWLFQVNLVSEKMGHLLGMSRVESFGQWPGRICPVPGEGSWIPYSRISLSKLY